MLKMEWIIDNAGRLVVAWKDRSEPGATPNYLYREPVSKTVAAPGTQDGACPRWLRAATNGGTLKRQFG
jgi:hypothetical protein